jgi:hypothetical protein
VDDAVMDVWLQGWGLFGLWVVAGLLALLVVLVWVLLLDVSAIRQAVAPAPARRTATSIAANFPGPETAENAVQPDGSQDG